MKRISYLLLVCTCFFSCDTKQKENANTALDSTTVGSSNIDSAAMNSDAHYYWTSELNQKNGLVMKKSTAIPADSLSADAMLEKINGYYPEIHLKYIRVSNDSIFLRVNKSTYLSEQMGTSGAEAYLAEVTYNFTEITGINAVDIRFKTGDHAEPGTYTRTDFVNESHK